MARRLEPSRNDPSLAARSEGSAPAAVVCGLVTIGQSPRADIVPELAELLREEAEVRGQAGVRTERGSTCEGAIAPEIRFIEDGALDGLDEAGLAAVRPRPGEAFLATRLRDASGILVARKRIGPLVQATIGRLEAAGAGIVALLCTDPFNDVKSGVPLIRPYLLLRKAVAELPARSGLARPACVGVLVPEEGQFDLVTANWREAGVVLPASVPPYGGPEAVAEALTRAAARLKDRGAEVILFDCLGYTEDMARTVERETGLPVIHPRAEVARAIALFARLGSP